MNIKPEDLRIMIDTLDEGLIIQNMKSEILGYNPRALEILGLTSSQLLGKTSFDPNWMAIKEDGSPFPGEEHPVPVTIRTGEPQFNVIMGVRKPNKDLTWISINSRMLTKTSEQLVICTFHEITNLINLNHELKEKKNELELILSSLDDLIIEINKEEEFINIWASAPEKLLDLPDNFYGKKLTEFFPSPIVKLIRDTMNKIRNSDYQTEQIIDFPYINNTASFQWFQGRLRLIQQKDKESFLLIISDITDKKEVENKLFISEQKWLNTTNFSTIGKALISLEGKIMDVNPALCKITGFESVELINADLQKITNIADMSGEFDTLLQKLKNKEIESFNLEKRLIHKKGHDIWVLFSKSLVWKDEFSPLFYIAQIQEISQQKQMIDDLASKNRSLEILTQDLERKISQLEEFNQIVAHNLRMPFSNLTLLLGLLEENNTPEKQDEYYGYLKESIRQLNSNFMDLNEVLKVQGNKDITFEECNIDELIHNTTSMLQAMILEKKAVIKIDTQVKTIHYPKVYFHNILFNLISNSLKFGNPAIPTLIHIHSFQKETNVVLCIEDNGLGVDLDKYGDQIFKLHKTFHRGYDGKGIGLFKIKTQVETLGGSIDIDSKPLLGTKITINFRQSLKRNL